MMELSNHERNEINHDCATPKEGEAHCYPSASSSPSPFATVLPPQTCVCCSPSLSACRCSSYPSTSAERSLSNARLRSCSGERAPPPLSVETRTIHVQVDDRQHCGDENDRWEKEASHCHHHDLSAATAAQMEWVRHLLHTTTAAAKLATAPLVQCSTTPNAKCEGWREGSAATFAVSPMTPSSAVVPNVEPGEGDEEEEDEEVGPTFKVNFTSRVSHRGFSVDTATTAGDWDDWCDFASAGNNVAAEDFSPLTRAQERRRAREEGAVKKRMKRGDSSTTSGGGGGSSPPPSAIIPLTVCSADASDASDKVSAAVAIGDNPQKAEDSKGSSTSAASLLNPFEEDHVCLSPLSTRYAASQSMERVLLVSPDGIRETNHPCTGNADDTVNAAPTKTEDTVAPPLSVTASSESSSSAFAQLLLAQFFASFNASESNARRCVAMEEERDRSAVLEVKFIKMSIGELGRLAAGLLEENRTLRRKERQQQLHKGAEKVATTVVKTKSVD